jgi:hypothetical protein
MRSIPSGFHIFCNKDEMIDYLDFRIQNITNRTSRNKKLICLDLCGFKVMSYNGFGISGVEPSDSITRALVNWTGSKLLD